MSLSNPTIILFDVDGTLIASSATGRKALERAFMERHGRSDACDHFSFAGMTDRAIFREGLRTIGAEVTEAEIDATIALYVTYLAGEVESAEHYGLHPCILEALDALVDLPHVALGLGTGNVERGARTKIERVRLNHYFEFGGFGCDAEPRAALIRVGAERGAARLGLPLEACRLIIVGDTPKDIAAAHANAGICIAVATGSYSHEALVESGGDLVCHDLSDPRALALLLGEGISDSAGSFADEGGE